MPEIRYKDVSPNAKLVAEPTSTDVQPFVDFDQLNQNGGEFPRYDTCEHNSCVLDGQSLNVPLKGGFYGYWSNSLSDKNGNFLLPPKLIITFLEPITAIGLSLEFDKKRDEFSPRFNIKTYLNNELKNDNTYICDSVEYFTNTSIISINKIEITFYSTNIPERYLKMNIIDYGIIRIFASDELRALNMVEEVNLLSTEVSINTAGFTLQSKSDVEFIFQKKQPLEISHNGQFLGTSFIDSSDRSAKRTWTVKCVDYVGLMEKSSYTGGIINGVSAYTLLKDMLDQVNIPFTITESVSNTLLYGYLPIDTLRNCVQQIAFALGCMVDTSKSSKVNLIVPNENVVKNFIDSEIMLKQTFKEADKVTEVRLTEYSYSQASEETEVAKDTFTGVQEIQFSEPLHTLTLTGGTIVKSGSNYAIINANGAYVLKGKRYNVSTRVLTKRNPTVSSLDLPNIVEITSCTLISKQNSAIILEKAYNYFMRNKKSVMTVKNKDIKVGDYIQYDGDYLGIKKGHLTRNAYTITGNELVGNIEVVE